jgi:hypothetical protein
LVSSIFAWRKAADRGFAIAALCLSGFEGLLWVALLLFALWLILYGPD